MWAGRLFLNSLQWTSTNLPIPNSCDQDLYSPTILKDILCLFLQDFVNLNVTNVTQLQKSCYIKMLLNIDKSGEQD